MPSFEEMFEKVSLDDEQEPTQFNNVKGCPSNRGASYPHVLDIENFDRYGKHAEDTDLTAIDAVAT